MCKWWERSAWHNIQLKGAVIVDVQMRSRDIKLQRSAKCTCRIYFFMGYAPRTCKAQQFRLGQIGNQVWKQCKADSKFKNKILGDFLLLNYKKMSLAVTSCPKSL